MTFTLQLDRERTLNFDEASAERFLARTGIHPSDTREMIKGSSLACIHRTGILIWASLTDEDRAELSPEKVAEFITAETSREFVRKASSFNTPQLCHK